ncbi:hypothetical protein Tco_0374586 [Tanacetum coccineum]
MASICIGLACCLQFLDGVWECLLTLSYVFFRASVLPLEVPPDETEASPMDDRRSKKKEMEERSGVITCSGDAIVIGLTADSIGRKSTFMRSRISVIGFPASYLRAVVVNSVGNVQTLDNEPTSSSSPATKGDSSHVGTSVSTQRKRTRENVQAISLPAEDASSKRRRGPTTSVGNRRPRRSVCNSGEGCSSFNNGDDDADNDDTTEPIEFVSSTKELGFVFPSITKDASFKKANEKHRELLSESGSQTALNDVETELLELRLSLLVEMEKRKQAEVP